MDEGAWRFRFPPHFPRRPLAVTYLKIALAYCLQWYEPLPLRKWQHFNSGWQVKGWYLQALFFDGDSKATCVRIDIRYIDVLLERVACTWDVLTCVQLNVVNLHIHGFAALSIHDFRHRY